MSSTIVPLISSGVAGPLGVLHLPRLWQKASLEARGKLAAGYPGCGAGYDQMTLTALGLDREAFVSFIASARPSYAECEAWVRAQPGVKLDAASIEQHNASVRGYIHSAEARAAACASAGLPDDANAPQDAVMLNQLDDWAEFHRAELK